MTNHIEADLDEDSGMSWTFLIKVGAWQFWRESSGRKVRRPLPSEKYRSRSICGKVTIHKKKTCRYFISSLNHIP